MLFHQKSIQLAPPKHIYFLELSIKKKQTKYTKTTSYKFLENVVSLLNYNFGKNGLSFLFIL